MVNKNAEQKKTQDENPIREVSHAFSLSDDWHAEDKERTQRKGAARWSLSRRRQDAKARGAEWLGILSKSAEQKKRRTKIPSG